MIFAEVIDSYIEKLASTNDRYFRERADDLRHIRTHVMLTLLGRTETNLRNLSEDTIVVASTLSPSQTAAMDKKKVKGIVTELGGKTSHSAILARALEIPTIVSASDITKEIRAGDVLIVDANHCKIIVNPGEQVIKEYQTARSVYDKFINNFGISMTCPLKPRIRPDHGLGQYRDVEELDAAITHGRTGDSSPEFFC